MDGRGSVVIVGALKSGELVGGYNPTGWESRDDYRATPRAFLFCETVGTAAADAAHAGTTERAWTKLGVLGPGDVAIFDYARGGPQFGAADLVIGAPLAPVMGGLAGPDTMDDTRTAGELRSVQVSLGGSYERMPSGNAPFPSGELTELEAYCNVDFGLGEGRLQVAVGSLADREWAEDANEATPPSIGCIQWGWVRIGLIRCPDGTLNGH